MFTDVCCFVCFGTSEGGGSVGLTIEHAVGDGATWRDGPVVVASVRLALLAGFLDTSEPGQETTTARDKVHQDVSKLSPNFPVGFWTFCLTGLSGSAAAEPSNTMCHSVGENLYFIVLY